MRVCYLPEAADAIEELQQIAWHYEESAYDYFKDVCYYLERVPKWIPVTERLPDFEGSVLCMRKSYIHRGMRHQEIMYVDEQGFYNRDDVYAAPGNVTHWMPLPEPPKEDNMTHKKAASIINMWDDPMCPATAEERTEARRLAIAALERDRWISEPKKFPNTDERVVGYFGGGAFDQLRWFDFVTTLSDGSIVALSNERDIVNEHLIAVFQLPEPPEEE